MAGNNLVHLAVMEERHDFLIAIGETIAAERVGDSPMGFSVNEANSNGETPLLLAIRLVIEQKNRHVAQPPYGRPVIEFGNGGIVLQDILQRI